MGAANQSGQVQGAFSSFRADDPQLIVDIDRDKARSLGLPLAKSPMRCRCSSARSTSTTSTSTTAPIASTSRPISASAPARRILKQLYARAANGEMIPLDAVVRLRETTAPQVISHYNLFRSAEITGNPAPGRSSGQTLDAMEQLARANLPAGYDFAWSGQSLEERLAGGQSGLIFG
jgi:HAE1 family hydrophobic/amphiphilic exporter-1